MTGAISRRNFLVAGGMSAAAAAVSPLVASPASPQAVVGLNLGLASYTLRNFTRAQLIGFMKELNVSALNAKDVKDHLPSDPTAEAQALADYQAAGISLHAAGVISLAQDSDDDMRSKFEYVKRAGLSVLVAGDPAPQALPRVEKFVKEYDIRVAIHNHGPEDKIWPSPLEVYKAVQPFDSRIGCCIDVGHTVRAGVNIIQAIDTVRSRLYNLHIKDLTDFNDKNSQVAVGRGKMPIDLMFGNLISNRYTGYVDLEYEVHADDPMLGVDESFAYMRGVLAGMGHSVS